MENPRVDENANNEERVGNNGHPQDDANNNSTDAQPCKKQKLMDSLVAWGQGPSPVWYCFDECKLVKPSRCRGYEFPDRFILSLSYLRHNTASHCTLWQVYPEQKGWWPPYPPVAEWKLQDYDIGKRTEDESTQERLKNYAIIQAVLDDVDRVKIANTKRVLPRLLQLDPNFLREVKEKVVCHLEEIKF